MNNGKNGGMYIARSSDELILKKSDYGGVVTSLLKYALESKTVDAVVTVKARDGNRYDGIPVLITDPQDVIETVGSLHSSTPNISRFLKEYLHGGDGQKLAVTCKPCDARGIIELYKRNKIWKDNLILIGLNCTGTFSPTGAKRMFEDEFGVNPMDVVREDIDDGKLTIKLKDGTELEKDLAELENKGYSRRENCRRCDVNIPVMADIACGKWGAEGKKATFIESCSDRGFEFINNAIEAGCIKVETPDKSAIEVRRKKDEEEIRQAKKWQEKDFAELKGMSLKDKFKYWFGHFNQCIKCYGCRDTCPICYCDEGKCFLEAKRKEISTGIIPPGALFSWTRVMHVVDSCVNCGQCQDVCPSEIPLNRLIHMVHIEIGMIFNYKPGMDIESRPPLRIAPEEEVKISDVMLNSKKFNGDYNEISKSS